MKDEKTQELPQVGEDQEKQKTDKCNVISWLESRNIKITLVENLGKSEPSHLLKMLCQCLFLTFNNYTMNISCYMGRI